MFVHRQTALRALPYTDMLQAVLLGQLVHQGTLLGCQVWGKLQAGGGAACFPCLVLHTV